jgi:hypothetical protein
MKVLFGFAAQFIGQGNNIIDLPDGTTHEQIEELFEKILGLPYDDNCYYKILKEE